MIDDIGRSSFPSSIPLQSFISRLSPEPRSPTRPFSPENVAQVNIRITSEVVNVAHLPSIQESEEEEIVESDDISMKLAEQGF